MHKRLLIGGMALALAGCAAQQPPPGGVQVEDLSKSKAPATQRTQKYYTVKSGDTLYDIAWRHDMDYRDMARFNDIQPPYTLQPGQKLALGVADGQQVAAASNADAQTAETSSSEAAAKGGAAVAAGAGAVVATGLGDDKSVVATGQDNGSLEWLLPEEGGSQTSAPGPVIGNEAAAGAEALQDKAAEQTGELKQHTKDTVASAKANVEEASAKAVEAEEQARKEAELAKQEAEKAAQDKAEQASEAKQAAEAQAREKAEQAKAASSSQKSYTPVAEVPWSWPVNGEVTGGFGESSSVTDGIDIAGQKGQSVRAAGPGIVVYAGDGVRGYGNLILLKHNDQYLSAYAHNDSLKVSENDVVNAGDVIATMGDTGADSVRLHFEVRKGGQPQNPLDYLPKR